MNLLGEDYETLQRAIPQGFAIPERVPREEAVGVSQYQSVDRQVAAHGHESVRLTQMRVREPKVII